MIVKINRLNLQEVKKKKIIKLLFKKQKKENMEILFNKIKIFKKIKKKNMVIFL